MSTRKRTIFVFIWAFLLGAFTMHYVDKFFLNTKISVQKNIFDFNNDPFSQMEQMQQEMMKNFGNAEDSAHTFSLNSADLNTREDEQYLYYEIDAKGLNQKNFSVQVEKGQIVIDGELESPEDSGLHFQSKFHRSFPIPENVDTDKVQLENEKEKIIIKIPKIK